MLRERGRGSPFTDYRCVKEGIHETALQAESVGRLWRLRWLNRGWHIPMRIVHNFIFEQNLTSHEKGKVQTAIRKTNHPFYCLHIKRSARVLSQFRLSRTVKLVHFSFLLSNFVEKESIHESILNLALVCTASSQFAFYYAKRYMKSSKHLDTIVM